MDLMSLILVCDGAVVDWHHSFVLDCDASVTVSVRQSMCSESARCFYA